MGGGVRPSRKARPQDRREPLRAFQTRGRSLAMREALVLAVAATAAILFIRHDLLYLRGSDGNGTAPLASYVLATTIFYLGLRMIVLAVDLRPPKAHAELVRCPECGQWLDDPTPSGRDHHGRTALTPKPSAKEVLAAVALRKAVDAARTSTQGLEDPDGREAIVRHAAIENLTNGDLIRALEDPDALERLLHSPNPPFPKDDPRLRR